MYSDRSLTEVTSLDHITRSASASAAHDPVSSHFGWLDQICSDLARFTECPRAAADTQLGENYCHEPIARVFVSQCRTSLCELGSMFGGAFISCSRQ